MLNDFKSPEIFLDKFDSTAFGAKIDCYTDNGKAFYVRYYTNGHTDENLHSDYHVHGYNQMIVHLNGKLEATVNDDVCERQMGDVLITRAGEPHAMVVSMDDSLEYIQLDFPLDAFDGMDGAEIFLDVFNKREFCEGNLLRPDPEYRDQIIKAARKIVGVLGSDIKSKLLVYSYVVQLMYAVDSVFKSKNFFFVSDKMPNAVFEAIQYIYANISTVETVGEIAANVNVSTSYLTRLFKKNLGCSPYEYLVDRRIENAKILMCYKGLNVSEACEEVGFKDYSSFIALFKKKTGFTPLAYKKAHS